MKNLFVFLVIGLTSVPTFASFACFVNKPTSNASSHGYMIMAYSEQMPQAMQCTTKVYVQKGLTAVSVSFGVSGLIAGCTGLGMPVAVAFEVGGLFVQVLDMVVGELPCDETTPVQNVKLLVNEAVCTALEQNGINCQLQ